MSESRGTARPRIGLRAVVDPGAAARGGAGDCGVGHRRARNALKTVTRETDELAVVDRRR